MIRSSRSLIFCSSAPLLLAAGFVVGPWAKAAGTASNTHSARCLLIRETPSPSLSVVKLPRDLSARGGRRADGKIRTYGELKAGVELIQFDGLPEPRACEDAD